MKKMLKKNWKLAKNEKKSVTNYRKLIKNYDKNVVKYVSAGLSNIWKKKSLIIEKRIEQKNYQKIDQK